MKRNDQLTREQIELGQIYVWIRRRAEFLRKRAAEVKQGDSAYLAELEKRKYRRNE